MEPKVIKTIESKDLPDDVKKKAIEEAREIAEKNLADFGDVKNIDGFAYWDKTPSGNDFWRNIDEANEIHKET